MLISSGNKSKSAHVIDDLQSSSWADQCSRFVQLQVTHTVLLHSSPTLAHRHISRSHQVSEALSGKLGLKTINVNIWNNIMGIQCGMKSMLLINNIESGGNFLDE